MTQTESWKNNRFNYLFLLLALTAGLLVYKDYGLCWDEVLQVNNNGRIVYDYVFNGQKAQYLSSGEKYHGAVYELFLFATAKAINLNTSREIFLYRHLVTYIFFWLSGFVIIAILNRLYKNRWITLAGLAMYFLSPRIFPDAFYNSKDIPFLIMTTLSVYSFLRMKEKTNAGNVLLHAIFCGLAIAIRITGVLLPVISLIVFVFRLYGSKDRIKQSGYIILFLILTCLSTILFWPVLWTGPAEHFLAAWNEMRKFDWHQTVLFMGKFVYADNLPWYYLPFWIYVTTPPVYLLMFTGSLFAMIFSFFRSSQKVKFIQDWSFFILLIFTPVVSVIIFKSIVYDGWRHVYFVYVPFVIISCYFLHFINESAFQYKKSVAILLGICFLFAGRDMVKLHPYEHVYFNSLYYKGLKGARFQMEMDYWGLTYQEALRYILDHDNREKIRVLVDNPSGVFNVELLKDFQKVRLDVDINTGKVYDYQVSNYRWRNTELANGREIFKIERDSASLCTVLRLMK